jgi:hypothetical protein
MILVHAVVVKSSRSAAVEISLSDFIAVTYEPTHRFKENVVISDLVLNANPVQHKPADRDALDRRLTNFECRTVTAADQDILDEIKWASSLICIDSHVFRLR